MSDREYYFDTAQICLNGHVICTKCDLYPEETQKYCKKCGAPTINKCAKCGEKIKGDEHAYGERVVRRLVQYSRPSFCTACGQPFPWTESAIRAARELAEEQDELNAEEKTTLKNSIDDLVRDTPGATIAASRFKKMMTKCGKVASDGFKNILFNLMSMEIAKHIWPQ